jgi:hypothetical protein
VILRAASTVPAPSSIDRRLAFGIIRVMTFAWRARMAVRMLRSTLHPLRPQSYRQVWLSATAVPLAVLVIGLALRLIFHTWPQFDPAGAVVAASYIAFVGGRQSLALRRRRRGLSWSTEQDASRRVAR